MNRTEKSLRPIRPGDKVIRDTATHNEGKVRLGDNSPVFVRPIRPGDKVIRDAATHDQGQVRLGDNAPVFVRPIRPATR